MAKLNEPDDDGNPFVSLADLLSVNVQAGNLASVIEKVGICCWDEYGRYKHFPKNEAQAAFDALAKARGMSYEQAQTSAAGDWGWSAADLPDIESLTQEGLTPNSIKIASRISGLTREVESLHLIIVGLCMAYNIDISKKNRSRVKKIEDGLEMADPRGKILTRTTINKYLDQASLYIPKKDKD